MAKTRSTLAKTAQGEPRVAQLERELENWRKGAVPDASAPLEASDVARLVRDCIDAFGVAAAAENFSVNTVHYYRRKDILDEPEGRTAAARYALRHVWQAVGARLAGFLGLVTLAEARDVIRGAPDATLRRFVAARIADARARDAARQHVSGNVSPRPHALAARSLGGAVPAAAMTLAASVRATATVFRLDGDALCLIPSGHAALRSITAARALVDGLARQLGLTS